MMVRVVNRGIIRTIQLSMVCMTYNPMQSLLDQLKPFEQGQSVPYRSQGTTLHDFITSKVRDGSMKPQ
jgi:hypothetical protein